MAPHARFRLGSAGDLRAEAERLGLDIPCRDDIAILLEKASFGGRATSEPAGRPAHGGRRRGRLGRTVLMDAAEIQALCGRGGRPDLVRGHGRPQGRALESGPAPAHGGQPRRVRQARRRDPGRREEGVGARTRSASRPPADPFGPVRKARRNAPPAHRPAQSRTSTRSATSPPTRLSSPTANWTPSAMTSSKRPTWPPRPASTPSTSRPATATSSRKRWPPTTGRTAATAGRSQNRTRLLLEIVRRVREEAPGLMVTSRLSATDLVPFPYRLRHGSRQAGPDRPRRDQGARRPARPGRGPFPLAFAGHPGLEAAFRPAVR